MGILADAGKFLWTRSGDAVDKVVDGSYNILYTAEAWFHGNGAYNYLRLNLKTFYSREQIDQIDMKRCLKKLRKLSHSLANFNERKLNKLFRRYNDNPNRFNAVVQLIVDKFSQELEDFIDNYQRILTDLNQQLVDMNKESNAEIDIVYSSLTRIQDHLGTFSKTAPVYLPKTLLEDARKELKRLIKEKKRNIRRTYRIEKRIEHGNFKKLFYGTLQRIGIMHLIHKGRKLVQRYYKNRYRDVTENITAIENQLSSGKIEPDILTRLIHHLKNYERYDKMLKDLAYDTLVIFEIVKEDFDRATNGVAMFLGTFRNVEPVKNSKIATELKQIEKIHENLQNPITKTDEQRQAVLEKGIKDLEKRMNQIFNNLKHYSDRIKAEIQRDPEAFMKKV